ncbi:MAG: DUF2283 domain-containing protein [Candidatus Helarchaeota archaeon]
MLRRPREWTPRNDTRGLLQARIWVQGSRCYVLSLCGWEKEMKVYYDDEVDALYLKLSDETPEGVIEIDEGINIDTTCDNRIVGIEILNASKRMDLKTVLSYSVEFEKELMIQEAA